MDEADSSKARQNAKPLKSWITFGLIIAATATWFLSKGSTTCQALTNEVIALSKENASAIQPKMIDLVEVKTISSNDGELQCSGIGIFANGVKQNIFFRKFREFDKWWVKYEGRGSSF